MKTQNLILVSVGRIGMSWIYLSYVEFIPDTFVERGISSNLGSNGCQQKISSFDIIIIWYQQEISAKLYRYPLARKFYEIARKCVKLSFRKWKDGTSLDSNGCINGCQRKISSFWSRDLLFTDRKQMQRKLRD